MDPSYREKSKSYFDSGMYFFSVVLNFLTYLFKIFAFIFSLFFRKMFIKLGLRKFNESNRSLVANSLSTCVDKSFSGEFSNLTESILIKKEDLSNILIESDTQKQTLNKSENLCLAQCYSANYSSGFEPTYNDKLETPNTKQILVT
jgi:hypothetical protein